MSRLKYIWNFIWERSKLPWQILITITESIIVTTLFCDWYISVCNWCRLLCPTAFKDYKCLKRQSIQSTESVRFGVCRHVTCDKRIISLLKSFSLLPSLTPPKKPLKWYEKTFLLVYTMLCIHYMYITIKYHWFDSVLITYLRKKFKSLHFQESIILEEYTVSHCSEALV